MKAVWRSVFGRGDAAGVGCIVSLKMLVCWVDVSIVSVCFANTTTRVGDL